MNKTNYYYYYHYYYYCYCLDQSKKNKLYNKPTKSSSRITKALYLWHVQWRLFKNHILSRKVIRVKNVKILCCFDSKNGIEFRISGRHYLGTSFDRVNSRKVCFSTANSAQRARTNVNKCNLPGAVTMQHVK